MNTIKIAKGQEELTFNSWQEIGKHFSGKETPVSSATATRMLERNGFKVLSVDKVRGSRSKINLVEYVLKNLNTIDKDKIKELQKQRDEAGRTARTSKEAQRVIKLNQEIEELQNPTLTKEDLITKFTSKVNEYYKNKEEENQEA